MNKGKKSVENPLHHFKLSQQLTIKKQNLKKLTMIQEASGSSTPPNTARGLMCKGYNT